MRTYFFLCLAVFSYYCSAQGLENFTRLKSEGPIPDFFVKFLDDKISEDNDKLKKEETITRKNASEFSVITNYQLQQLIQGGKVLYGDPLTNYANGVLDKLKEASDENLDHIQIYTLKSNEVNAFATHQGVIFVTVGLIGQLENEAQLAFILAHEITHVQEKHSQLSYQYSQDLAKKARYGDGSISDYYQYSRENEEDADKAGFDLAVKAGYTDEELYKTFRVLLYSYLPIDEKPIDYNQWASESFSIPEKYKLPADRVNEISAEDDVDDDRLTHPNIATRRKNARTSIDINTKNPNSKIYQYGTKESFEKLRTTARFEMLNIFIQGANYIKGLYHSMILRKEYPKNVFLINSQSMIWYGLSAYETRSDNTPYSFSYRKKEGEIQHLSFMLNKLKSHELSLLATQQIWQNSLANTDNAFLKSLRKEVLRDFVFYPENKLTNYATSPRVTDSTPIEPVLAELSKYDKIAKKRKTGREESLFYYSLINIINDENFIADVADAKRILKEKEEEKEKVAELNLKPQKNSMDVSSLIMTTPNYNEKDSRKSAKSRIKNNETTENKLVTSVKENAEKLDITLRFIDDFGDPNFTTENYNDFSLLYDYLGERAHFEGTDFVPYNAQYIESLTEKYNSNYVGIVGIYTNIRKRPFNGSYAVLSVLTVYTLPLYLKWQLTADKNTEYGFYVMNLKSHNPAFTTTKSFGSDMNVHLQNAHIYNSLNQIKK